MEENVNAFPEREHFFLKQYWLAQVIFYLVYDSFGSGGMIFVRSLLLLLIILTASWQMMRSGVKPYINFIISFVLFKLTLGSLGERPVLFSMLFTAVVIFLLEEYREKRGRTLLFLIPVMLIWANMHGAFVLGVIIITAYMLSEAVKLGFKKSNFTRKERELFFAIALLAILISYVNPTGWDAFSMSLNPKYDIFQKDIQEYESNFSTYVNKTRSLDYYYFALAFIFPLVLVLRNRKFDLAHFIVLFGFFVMSMKAVRFNTFYAITAAMILGKECNYLTRELLEKRLSNRSAFRSVETGLVIAMLVSSLLFLAGVITYGKPRLGIARNYSVPEKAVDFIEKNNLPGNMFNDYGYGGYIAWRLYPKKTFIDSRSLNKTVMNEAKWVENAYEKVAGIKTRNEQTPLWEAILRHYNFNYIVVPYIDIYNSVVNLVFELIGREDWRPIYIDKISVVFIKNSPENKDIIAKYGIEDTVMYNAIISRLVSQNMGNRFNPRYLISLGRIFSKMGRNEDAIEAFRYAVQLWDLPEIKMKISELEGIIERQAASGGNSPKQLKHSDKGKKSDMKKIDSK